MHHLRCHTEGVTEPIGDRTHVEVPIVMSETSVASLTEVIPKQFPGQIKSLTIFVRSAEIAVRPVLLEILMGQRWWQRSPPKVWRLGVTASIPIGLELAPGKNNRHVRAICNVVVDNGLNARCNRRRCSITSGGRPIRRHGAASTGVHHQGGGYGGVFHGGVHDLGQEIGVERFHVRRGY
jgi:hypothetical protein